MGFIQDALRTESSQFHELQHEGKVYSQTRLLHSALGMQTEAAEFSDAIKKSLFYGKSLDVVNLKEELGDLLWYMAIAMDELGTDFDAEAKRVVKKLKARYPEKFTSDNALNRDLGTERQILEKD
jgi:NTP pyrophosphatase (non-canonical NTP hydrolase)